VALRIQQIDAKATAAAAFALVCALLFIAQINWRPAPFSICVEVKTQRCAKLQALYDAGHGIRQQDSATQFVDSRSDFSRVRFPIDAEDVRELRLVNHDATKPLELRQFVQKQLGGKSRIITAADLRPLTPDTQISQAGEVIRIESGVSNTPAAVAIQMPSPLASSLAIRAIRWTFVVLLGGAAAGLVLLQSNLTSPLLRNAVSEIAKSDARNRVVVLVLLAVIYVVASLCKLNGSSTELWRYYADRELPSAGVILGSPKEIRLDEWVVHTPWILSQAARSPAFATMNPGVGSGATTLVTNVPVWHWSTLLRPGMWAFFLTDAERAFAFYWNFKWFGLLLSAFLFFGVITRGRTLLDLGGALFLLFAPYIQWWFSTPTCLPEMLAMTLFALWAVAMIFCAESKWKIVAASVLLVVASGHFIFCCYPRFQVPLAYLALGALLAGLVQCPRNDELHLFRWMCVTFAVTAAGFVTWSFWQDVASVVRTTAQLVYPGQIVSTGGSFPWFGLVAPFIEFGMTEDHFPAQFGNVCEAAGFLFLAPLLAAMAIRDAFQSRGERFVLTQLAIIALGLLFMLVGVPLWLAQLSGWSYVSSIRANLLIGVASTIALIRYLALRKRSPEKIPAGTSALLFVTASLLLFGLLFVTNIRLGEFETRSTIIASALLFALLFVCLWQRHAVATCILLLVPQVYATALVNPVARGLAGIERSTMFEWFSQAQQKKPGGNWMVLGDSARAEFFSNFVKATGANVLGGIRCNPDEEMLQVLDPAHQFASVYNRYAWIHFVPANVPEPSFELIFTDAYAVKLPLRKHLFDSLGVQYLVAVDLALSETEVPGFRLLGEREDCRLFVRDGP
jgi:hypothetical protein